MIDFDIDIDLPSSFDCTKIFENVVKASIYRDGKLLPHPCGAYFQQVPVDPLTNLSAVDYQTAEQLGCFKVDFLHMTVYDHFSSREEIKRLLDIEPDWDLLKHPSVVSQLFQVSKHYDLIQSVNPRSVIEVADVLALIRPKKIFMLKKYLEDPDLIRRELYKTDGDGYAFKKAHAIAYALVIVLQLHLIKSGVNFK